MTEDAAHRGSGAISRRGLGRGAMALGGALALASVPFAATAAGTSSGAGAGGGPGGPHRPTLRRGTPARAGLLAPHLDRLVTDAEAFLQPS
ncbi:serine hydrolase, partial [Streptomyces zhihengii]